MARNHATLNASIVSDPAWRALGPGPQWLYVHLLCQPDLKMTGICNVMPERWAAGAKGLSPAFTSAWFGELVDAGFLLHDPTTAELLIRTFTKHDLRASQLTKPVAIGFWSHWNGGLSLSLKRYVVAYLPGDAWVRLERHVPVDSADLVGEIRRSGPFEWEPPVPFEWQVESPFEPPSTFHPVVATSIISPTGGGCSDPGTVSSADGTPEGDNGTSSTTTSAGVAKEDTSDHGPSTNVDSGAVVLDPTPTTVGVLAGDALEQAIRRTAVLIGRRQTVQAGAAVTDAEAYAATCTRTLLDKTNPEPRAAIGAALQAGCSPEDIAADWGTGATDVFGFRDRQRPSADDPNAIREAGERARRREEETRQSLAAMAAIEPAPMPEALRRRCRTGQP